MYFILYSHNVIVKGAEQAAIYDLELGKILYIPLVFADILDEMYDNSIQTIQNKYAPNNPKILQDYIQLLLDNDLGFYTEEPEKFPKLENSYYSSVLIQNAVLITDLEHYDFSKILNDLDEIGCHHIEMRLLLESETKFGKFCKILSQYSDASFISIILVIKYENYITEQLLDSLLGEHTKIEKIIIYGSPQDNMPKKNIVFKKDTLVEMEKKVFNNNKLVLNIKYYSESLMYNTTYNNKVAVDTNGNIKNIVYDNTVFGNVNSDSLESIVHSKEFQKLWRITPNDIEELKDSPLRYAIYNTYPIKQNQEKYFIDTNITFS